MNFIVRAVSVFATVAAVIVSMASGLVHVREAFAQSHIGNCTSCVSGCCPTSKPKKGVTGWPNCYATSDCRSCNYCLTFKCCILTNKPTGQCVQGGGGCP